MLGETGWKSCVMGQGGTLKIYTDVPGGDGGTN